MRQLARGWRTIARPSTGRACRACTELGAAVAAYHVGEAIDDGSPGVSASRRRRTPPLWSRRLGGLACPWLVAYRLLPRESPPDL